MQRTVGLDGSSFAPNPKEVKLVDASCSPSVGRRWLGAGCPWFESEYSALFRATSNPQATLKLEAAYRQLAVNTESSAVLVSRDEPLSLRPGAVREAVIEVMMESETVLPTLEIQRRVGARLGRPVKRHTVDTRLYSIATDSTLPIVKVGPACYALAEDGAARTEDDELGGQMLVVKERVLAVLQAASEPMRPAEIWSAVEAEAGEKVSYDAVASFLSLAARHPNISIRRVKRGWYALG